MKQIKYETLTDSELAEITKEKNKLGCATKKALNAANELYNRYHWNNVVIKMIIEKYIDKYEEE